MQMIKQEMISVTLLTKNSAATLAATLDSLSAFAEVLIYDTGSTDSTFEIAKKYSNVKLVSEHFSGFGAAHNSASSVALHDWILSIDSDEVLSKELIQEILMLKLNPKKIYSLNRCNYFLGQRIKCCAGWYPDPVVRLYHRKITRFTEDVVHEKVITQGLETIALKAELSHTPYRSMDDFLTKMQNYSTLFAEQNQGKKHSSLWLALLHAMSAFFRNYFLKRGCLGGKRGFIISIYNAHTTYYKYLKLALKNQSI